MFPHNQPAPGRGARRVRWVGRWFAGRPLHGPRLTDATFLRDATQALVPGQLAPYRQHRAGWKRSARRQTAAFGLPALAWQWAAHPARTALLGVVAAVCAGGWWWRYRLPAWQARRVDRSTVQPLHAVLSDLLGLPRTARAADYLTVPAGADKPDGPPVTARMPAGWAPTQAGQDKVAALVVAKVGIPAADADITWSLRGVPTLVVRRAPTPPDLVRWSDTVADVEASRPGDIILGAGPRGGLYRWDLGSEDPHAGFSVNTGRGKSSLLAAVAAQVCGHGGTSTAIDPKMTSFDDIAGMPGLRLANNPADMDGMWAAIAGFRGEMDRRKAAKSADPAADWAPALLMVDEVNVFTQQSIAHWQDVRDRDDKGGPPVWRDIAEVAWMGRAFRCHVILVGQRLDNRATGGFGLRDSLGLRGLAGYTPQQWKMLGPGGKMPAAQRPRGRWLYLNGAEQTWVQNVFAQPGELKAWVLARRAAACPPGVSIGVSTMAPTCDDAGSMDMDNEGNPVEWIVGLDAAAARAGLSRDALVKRRQRAGGQLPGESKQGRQPAFPASVLDNMRAWDTLDA